MQYYHHGPLEGEDMSMHATPWHRKRHSLFCNEIECECAGGTEGITPVRELAEWLADCMKLEDYEFVEVT